MDQNRPLDAGPVLRSVFIILLAAISLLVPQQSLGRSPDALPSLNMEAPTRDQIVQPLWARRLEQRLQAVDRAHIGDLGVYVKDLTSGIDVSLRADESWYLASGIKIPVAMAVLRKVENGEIALNTEIRLEESDYVDGAGQTNWHGPGSQLTVQYLMEQMLTVSDNTATDMLIRLVGLENVNRLVQELVPQGFGSVTTLADVRRQAYSRFHPNAFNLTGRDFFTIRKQSKEHGRIEALASVLNLTVEDFAVSDLDSAFAGYYATNLNGASLSAYGQLLQRLVQGHALQPESTQYIMALLLKVKTGKNRIKSGLPPARAFAHKTGTQHRRICDLGVVMDEGGARNPQALIAVCSRDFKSLYSAEAALREVAEAISESGLFDTLKIADARQK
ncbi:MAG: serine hydrolase [Pelovirga sp.]